MKKIISILIILSIMLISLPVFAQCTLSVSKSASEVLLGNNVKVTFTFSDSTVIGGFDVRVTYDSSKLTYVNASSSLGSNLDKSATGDQIRFLDFNGSSTATSCTLTVEFKTKAVGDAKVSIATNEVTDTDGLSLGAPTGSATVSIKEENKSSNANLKWLTVPSGCTLVPKFSKNVTEYTCTVPYSITKFPMDWETEDKDAKDSVTPLQTLKVGKNTRTVTVTAPDGTKKAYTVTVIREEAKETPSAKPTSPATPTLEPTPTAPPVTVFVNGRQYTISALMTLELPEGFVKEKYIYSSNEVESAVLGTLRLIQLFDGESDGLFIFDSKENSFKPYNSVKINEKTLTVLDERPEIANGLSEKHVIINDGEYTGWASEKLGEGYYILNVVNRLGENYTALYCGEDGSIQKLSPALEGILTSGASITASPTEEPPVGKNFSIDPVYIGIGACILILIAIIVVVTVLIVKASKKPPKPKRDWGLENNDPYDIAIDADEPEEEDDEDFE